MPKGRNDRSRQPWLRGEAGFSMLEVLIAVLILSLGLLGLAAMLGRALKAEAEAYGRAQAAILLSDMADRINSHRRTAPCFAQNYGTGVSATTACGGLSVDATVMANADKAITGWHNLLLGATESSGGVQVGGILGARGCVVIEATDPTLFHIALAWQGLDGTVVPAAPSAATSSLSTAVACGQGTANYGTSDALRRVIWTSVRIANLS